MSSMQRLYWILIAVAIAVAALCMVPRLRMERTNREADLVLPYGDVLDFCQAEGLPVDQTLARFKAAGINSLSYSEVTLDRLTSAGRVSAYGGADLLKALHLHQEPMPVGFTSVDQIKPDRNRLYLLVHDNTTLNELHTYLSLFLGNDRVFVLTASSAATPEHGPGATSALQASDDHPALLEVWSSMHALSAMGLGFSTLDLNVARNAGLSVYLRPQNRDRFQDNDVRKYFSLINELIPTYAVHGLVFEGSNNEILGYPDNLKTTVEEMKNDHLVYGDIEVAVADAAQKGSRTLGVDMCNQTVRVMSVVPATQLKLTPADAVDRFMLGARERNIRVLYVRFFPSPDAGKTLLDTNLAYVDDLHEHLLKSHFTIGHAQPFSFISPHSWALALMSLGAVAAGLLTLESFIVIPTWLPALALCGAAGGGFGLAVLGRGALWAKLMALEVGLVFPVLGLVLALPCLVRLGTLATSFGDCVKRAIGWLWVLSGMNVLGGLLVAGLLASTPFMLEADQFRGIKLIMVVSPFLVVWHYVTRTSPQRETVRTLLERRVAFWHLLAMAVLAASLAFYVARTGNTSPAGASDLERTVRNLLEQILVARPRFKEFALGHPALLLLAVALWRRRWLAGTWALVMCVAIGQVDVLDTFCHIHTPYFISLLRVFNGLWLGTLIGLPLAWLANASMNASTPGHAIPVGQPPTTGQADQSRIAHAAPAVAAPM
jgi:hypothetical protein